jgi:hypothetical protein
MNVKPSNGAHSAQVSMDLIVDGKSISITHMGPDYIRIDPTFDFPPCEACIHMQVDEDESQWKVRLPKGISKLSTRVELAVCEEEESAKGISDQAAVS